MGLFLAVVQIRKRGVVLDQLIGQSRDFLGTQVQEGRCFVDLNDLKRDHLHTLLPCYGWRVVYHLWLGKSRCNTRTLTLALSQRERERMHRYVFQTGRQHASVCGWALCASNGGTDLGL